MDFVDTLKEKIDVRALELKVPPLLLTAAFLAAIVAVVTTWTCNALGFLLVALFCLYLTEFQIKPEEATLEALFGVDYRAYKSSVRRWI